MFERCSLSMRVAGISALLIIIPAITHAQDVYYGGYSGQGIAQQLNYHSANTGTYFEEATFQHFSLTATSNTYSFGADSDADALRGMTMSIGSAVGSGSTDVGTTTGSRHASSDMTVTGVHYDVGDFHLSADSISSHAEVAGKRDFYTDSATSSWDNLSITVDGIQVVIPQSAGVDDVVFNQDGVKVMLNFQLPNGSGPDGGISVVPVWVTFNDYVVNGSTHIDGTANFGASGAGLQAVPEPASMLAFATLVGGFLVKRRRRCKD